MSEFIPLLQRVAGHVSRAPNGEAIVHGDRRVTYAELWKECAAVAAALVTRGLRPGDRVAIVLENSIDYVAAYYGTWLAGGVAVALNVSARQRELSAWIDHCGARSVFIEPRHPDRAGLLETLPTGVDVVTRAGGDGRARPWPLEAAVQPLIIPDIVAGDVAAIIYTSGTTGRPKGVTLTHGNLAANTASIIEYLALDQSDRVLNVLPFFYSYGNSVLQTHLAVGGTLVLENSLAFPQRILERMAAERVTGFPGVPSTFAVLLQSLDLRKLDLPSLRYVTQAGGAMPPAQVQRVRELLPRTRFFVMYGQTEATARLTYVPPDRLDAKLGSAGIPIPGVELEVRSDSDEPVAAGVVGEVCVRGDNVMAGYYRDSEATATALRQGWLHTGDIGRLDEDGFLFLQGRRSDIIKSGAHRISPLDIEEVIAALPQVAEVAVLGVPDEMLGEAIKAVVTLREGETLDGLAVQRHCSQQLPRYKVPKIVEFVDRLPRTSSGKIMRHRLVDAQHAYEHEVRSA